MLPLANSLPSHARLHTHQPHQPHPAPIAGSSQPQIWLRPAQLVQFLLKNPPQFLRIGRWIEKHLLNRYAQTITPLSEFLYRHRWIIGGSLAIFTLTGGIEFGFGRSPLGPDGRFGWWDNNIWGSENSQRVADVYSFSHIIHGMLFYGCLWLFARKLPVRYRFLIALLVEASWELLENSPIIISRYREMTIAQGYVGDSILNSLCDVLMAALGFWLASRLKLRVIVVAIFVMEVGCLLWVRDNLTLNVLMLVYPSDAIKAWQSAGKHQ